MTPGELKFALLLESKLNSIPDPEYRQLVVEVLMVVGLVAKASSQPSFGHTPILVDGLINLGLQLFLQDQVCNYIVDTVCVYACVHYAICTYVCVNCSAAVRVGNESICYVDCSYCAAVRFGNGSIIMLCVNCTCMKAVW